MFSAHNEGKPAVAERFVRTLKKKDLQTNDNVYLDVLDDIVDKDNNTFHTTIKMKRIDVKSDSHGECNVDSNEKNPKFEIDDHVGISK